MRTSQTIPGYCQGQFEEVRHTPTVTHQCHTRSRTVAFDVLDSHRRFWGSTGCQCTEEAGGGGGQPTSTMSSAAQHGQPCDQYNKVSSSRVGLFAHRRWSSPLYSMVQSVSVCVMSNLNLTDCGEPTGISFHRHFLSLLGFTHWVLYVRFVLWSTHWDFNPQTYIGVNPLRYHSPYR